MTNTLVKPDMMKQSLKKMTTCNINITTTPEGICLMGSRNEDVVKLRSTSYVRKC